MDDTVLQIVCYADDAVLIAGNEDDLQRLFNIFLQQYNMILCAEITKCITIGKEHLRYKLEIPKSALKHVLKFDYIGVEISSCKNFYEEARKHINLRESQSISGT